MHTYCLNGKQCFKGFYIFPCILSIVQWNSGKLNYDQVVMGLICNYIYLLIELIIFRSIV